MEGYGEFEVEALGFKVYTSSLLTGRFPRANIIVQHERLNLEKRLSSVSQDECASMTGGSVKTSDIARLMEMFQVCFLISRLEITTDSSVPRVPFSSIGTLSLLTMRRRSLIRPMLKITRPSSTGATPDRSRSGGESNLRNEPRPIRANRGSRRLHGNQAQAPILLANPVTEGRRNVPRRRFQSFSLTRLTSCE